VKRILDTLIKNGEVVRGSIGNLTYVTVTAAQVRNARLGDQGGCYVQGMYKSDPAYAAGIRPRDIIVSFNGAAVNEQSALQRLIADIKIGFNGARGSASQRRAAHLRGARRPDGAAAVGRRADNGRLHSAICGDEPELRVALTAGC
jgi:S1-C subfamily serine protease